MIKRTKTECRKCKHFLSFKNEVGMDFVVCGYGPLNAYRGCYKLMDGEINCPQSITESLNSASNAQA
ncbi:MAG: hypothetical protein LBT84_04875 [Spirochaetia bacterium]|jgi:hypothetical protein|nr:hypothetical protein [Spirochaetia bacterium]